MQVLFKKNYETPETLENDFTIAPIREELEKTRRELELAYAGFNYAVNPDMIDSYIYEINALQKRYKHLCELVTAENPVSEEVSYEQTAVHTLAGQT